MTDIVALELLYSTRNAADYGQRREGLRTLAIVHDATVLHYDRDFDLIAAVSDLSSRWIIPCGTGHSPS